MYSCSNESDELDIPTYNYFSPTNLTFKFLDKDSISLFQYVDLDTDTILSTSLVFQDKTFVVYEGDTTKVMLMHDPRSESDIFSKNSKKLGESADPLISRQWRGGTFSLAPYEQFIRLGCFYDKPVEEFEIIIDGKSFNFEYVRRSEDVPDDEIYVNNERLKFYKDGELITRGYNLTGYVVWCD